MQLVRVTGGLAPVTQSRKRPCLLDDNDNGQVHKRQSLDNLDVSGLDQFCGFDKSLSRLVQALRVKNPEAVSENHGGNINQELDVRFRKVAAAPLVTRL